MWRIRSLLLRLALAIPGLVIVDVCRLIAIPPH